MSKLFSRFNGSKEERADLNPTFGSNNPYRYAQSQPPEYAPPAGPSSSTKQAEINSSSASHNDLHESPPPYHDWTSIPDTALLPPPPSLNSEYSSTTNASYAEAEAARAWCASHPVHIPSRVHEEVLSKVLGGWNSLVVQSSNLKLDKSAKVTLPNSVGFMPTTVETFVRNASGIRRLRVAETDHCTYSNLPLYFAANTNPLLTEQPFMIYFEVKLLKLHSKDSTVAIGFISRPYPVLRQPGWHRASIGVHSDDGHRYVNDSWGGLEFTEPFKEGETIGLAIQFLPEPVPTTSGKGEMLQSEREVRSTLPKCQTRVFLVRNGAVTGSWNIDEERDAERDEGIAGLQGDADMYAAVGNYGDVDFEVRFFKNGEGFIPPPAA